MTLPYEIRTQIIQCIGTCFHYKDNVEAFFISCGIDKRLVSKHRDLAKFIWAKNLMSELDELPDGFELQRKILTELCKFRKLPDSEAQNPNAGLEALKKLKILAIENKFQIEETKRDQKQRNIIAEEKSKIILERSEKLSELKSLFYQGFSIPNRQEAGYLLEDILERLFPLFELDYRKSYKTETQQIDGHFRFEGFDYLVEAKWTESQPNEQEIGGFQRKVDTKLESTRGMFISINGFRDEVINSFQGKKSNIIFFTGEDLTHIIEGRIELKDVLRIKIAKAAQEGKVLITVTSILS